ncbi:hypothetical protein HOO54_17165 [Bacillus sp. WMMC1349]|uniref:hypothetical protein n=1 Tax=Bacillus sp. WMMC1349 TaxID=2736254 RepID=UPI001551E278|nr:hypothetical protein [Bacillus sp. WMMC1349]NPC93898.1 hypothetical protein [Bacillus sp. WMMC1349]
MYLFLFTVIYCVMAQILNVSYELSSGIYLIGIGLIKGLSSKEMKDVFNFKKTKDLYKENRFLDSLMELFSLILIFINSYLINYEPFSLFEFVVIFLLMALLYRFLFWGIIRKSKNWWWHKHT